MLPEPVGAREGVGRSPVRVAPSSFTDPPMSSVHQLLARHRTLKQRAVVPTYRALARTNVFYPPPRVFANSFPKAGTHLLSTLLASLPRMMFSGIHAALGDFTTDPERHGSPDAVRWDALRRRLEGSRNGQFVTGHFPAVEGLPSLLTDLRYSSLLMLRDPRDVLVSGAHYAGDLPSHDLHRRFTEQYPTLDERIMAEITGFAADEYGRGQASLGDRLESYLPWLDDPSVLVVRFEDMVGDSGGGSRERQLATVSDVAGHVGRRLSPQQLERTADRVWSPRSSTFRGGKTGGWREVLTDEHLETLQRTAGPQMARLGYPMGAGT
jgi:sulfotransferase 6B1